MEVERKCLNLCQERETAAATRISATATAAAAMAQQNNKPKKAKKSGRTRTPSRTTAQYITTSESNSLEEEGSIMMSADAAKTVSHAEVYALRNSDLWPNEGSVNQTLDSIYITCVVINRIWKSYETTRPERRCTSDAGLADADTGANVVHEVGVNACAFLRAANRTRLWR